MKRPTQTLHADVLRFATHPGERRTNSGKGRVKLKH